MWPIGRRMRLPLRGSMRKRSCQDRIPGSRAGSRKAKFSIREPCRQHHISELTFADAGTSTRHVGANARLPKGLGAEDSEHHGGLLNRKRNPYLPRSRGPMVERWRRFHSGRSDHAAPATTGSTTAKRDERSSSSRTSNVAAAHDPPARTQ